MANIEQQSLSTWTWKTFCLAAAGVIQVTAGVLLVALWIITIPFIDLDCLFPPGLFLMMQGSAEIVVATRTGLIGKFCYTFSVIFGITFTVTAIEILDCVLWVGDLQLLLV